MGIHSFYFFVISVLPGQRNCFCHPTCRWLSAKFLPFPRLLRVSKPYQRAPVLCDQIRNYLNLTQTFHHIYSAFKEQLYVSLTKVLQTRLCFRHFRSQYGKILTLGYAKPKNGFVFEMYGFVIGNVHSVIGNAH